MDKNHRELVMAKLYFKNKDYKMAEKSFNDYLNIKPDDVSALKLLGQVYEQINRFDKAFEMYERCYLAEPERTGVLLDICRILLMQGNCLDQDNVDPRKWYNLAVKAFPSNQIVLNLKALLSTLPSEEQVVVQKETPKKQMNNNVMKNSNEDALMKVLEKLNLISQRLDSIEDKMSNLTITQTSDTKTNPKGSTTPTPKAKATPNTIQAAVPTPAVVPTPAPLSTPLQVPKPAETLAPSLFSASLSTPSTFTPKSSGIKPAPSLFTASTTPLFSSAPVFTPPTVPPPSLSSNFTPASTAAPTANMTFSSNSPFNFSNNPDSMKNFNVSNAFSFLKSNATTVGKQGFETQNINNKPEIVQNQDLNPNASINFFAESIKKYDVPITFGSSQNPTSSTSAFNLKEDDKKNISGDNELVENEELPIENTCDMTPIEYKTGEEDEDKLFEHRTKLFRFRDKEFKERGLGNIKVLKHKETGKGRLIMRREAIGLVCLNCWDCTNFKQVRETQIQFSGVDASDGVAEGTIFLVKFKLKETADNFMKLVTSLFDSTSSPNTSIWNSSKKTNPKQNETNENEEKAEVELIDPKLDKDLVNKARELQLPDLFYHKLKNQESCGGCNGCEND